MNPSRQFVSRELGAMEADRPAYDAWPIIARHLVEGRAPSLTRRGRILWLLWRKQFRVTLERPTYRRGVSDEPSPHRVRHDPIGDTKAVWEPRSSRALTSENARQISENMIGFFRILKEWESAERHREQHHGDVDDQ